jgi:hypothetical protein
MCGYYANECSRPMVTRRFSARDYARADGVMRDFLIALGGAWILGEMHLQKIICADLSRVKFATSYLWCVDAKKTREASYCA